MSGAPTDQIAFGILRTRDLVELYYRGRMAVQVIENTPSIGDADGTLLFTQDPRRIRYEIILVNISTTTPSLVQIGSRVGQQSGAAPFYFVAPSGNLIITRNFRTDMEGVTLEQILSLTSGPSPSARTRVTILTPLPVDEEP